MVQKSLRKKLLIDGFNRNYNQNSKKNVPEYLNEKEGELVRAKIQNDNGFNYKVYRGNNEGVHEFIEYDLNDSIVEYLVHQDNLRVFDNHLIMKNPDVRRYSVNSETGRNHMELISKTKFMELTSI